MYTVDPNIERLPRPDSRHYSDSERRGPHVPDGYITGIMLAGEFFPTDKTSNYTLTADETVVYVDATNSGVKLTLPAAASFPGKFYYIKKIDSYNNAVTIVGDGNETIDGEQEIAINLQYAYVMVHCDGTEWFILGGEYVKMEDLLVQQIDLLEQIRKGIEDSNVHLAEGSGEELNKEE